MEGKGGQKLKIKVYSQGVRVIEDGETLSTHSLTHSTTKEDLVKVEKRRDGNRPR